MATYNRVSTTRSLGKKALQADVNKKKKELEEDSTRKWVQYLATLPTDQQNAARQELAQRMANPGNLRPATPSLRDMRYGVSSTQVVGNRELEAKNRAMGVYNTEAVAYNPDTAHLPSDSYMKQLQEALGVQLASSRVQDDFRRAQEERLSPWEDWYYNLAGEPDDYDLKAMDTLLTGKEYPSWYELTADERTKLMGDFTRMKAQVEGDLAQATPYQSQTPTLQARYDLLAKEQQRRSKGAAYQEMAAELQSSPTFEEDSKYTPSTGTSYMEYMKSKGPWGQITSAFDKSDDAAVLYDYIMNPEYAAEYEAANNYQGHSGGTPYMRSGYGQLTQDEKNVLAAAWAQSPETFTETLSALEEDKRLRIAYLDTERALQENTALTPAGAVPSWMAARAANLANGLLYPVQMAASMLGYDDPYSDLYAGNRYVQNVSGVQSQAAGDLLPWKVPFTDQRVGELFYNGITSAVDMGAALGIGGLTKAPALATQLIMSSQAASNELHERLQDGMDSTEAVIRSLLVGGIEALTEKYSIDEFLADPKSVWAFITKNMFTEASEEGMSDLLNTAADGFISSLYGHDSDLVTEYNALVAQLGDEKVAFQTVLTNYLHKLGGNVILGGFTGGMMGGVSGAQTDASRKAAGKTIADAGNVPQLLDIAATMGGESGEMGRALKQTREQGGKISNRQVGRLYETMYKELDDQSRSIIGRTMQDAVAERLVELGDDEQLAREVAEAIMPVVRNEKPSLGQTRTMARSQNSTQVIKELMYADDTTAAGQAAGSEWARTATEKANAASASSLRKMGELQATAVDQRMTDKAVKRSKVNAERLLGKKATDKKSLSAKVEGENVEILRVSQTVNGARLAVKAADGTTKEVDADDLELVSRPVAEIVTYVDDNAESMGEEQANLLLHTYIDGDAGKHITDFQQAYAAGFDGRELGQMIQMDESIARQVMAQGRKDAQAAEETRQKTIGAISSGRRGAVTFSENAVDTGSEKALKAVSGRLSDTQKKSVQAIKQIARVTGVNFVFFESQADDTGRYTAENGHYDVRTGTIYLDLNSGKNSTTDLAEYAILRTAGHELTHFMEHSSKEGYAALRDFVTTELTRRGQDFDALVRQKIENASTAGHPMTRAGAISEVVADASELMLRDSKAIERLAQKDQGLMAKIKGFVQSFVQKVRDAFSGVDAVHEEARVMMQELAEEFQQKWDFALEEAVEQEREGAVEAEPVAEAQDQFAIRDKDGKEQPVGTQAYENNWRIVANMEPVIALEGNPHKKNPNKDFLEMGVEYFEDIGGEAQSPVFGKVTLNESGIRHLIAQGITYRRSALLRAVKAVIENGYVIKTDENHKGNRFDTAIIAATVTLDTTPYYVGVVIRQDKGSENSYYFHDAVFVEKRKVSPDQLDAGGDNYVGSIRDLGEEPSVSIILSRLADYNREFAETQESLRDMPADLTREYIAHMTASDALNDVEKDAIRIYSREVGLLRTAQEKLNQVIAERDAQPEDKQKMYTQRVRDLRQMVSRHYDKLTQLEKAKGVAPLIQRSREYVQEYVQGKTAQDVENLITGTEQEVERLNKLIQAGNKDLVKERDRRVRDLKQLRNKATQALVDEQERYRQMIATDRAIRDKTRDAARIQEKIATRVRKLDKLRRHETDYKNVPEAFKPAVDTLVSMFTDNFGTMVFDAPRADRLASIYHKLLTVDGNDPMAQLSPFYDPDVGAQLDALKELAQRDAQLRASSGMTRMEKATLRLAINKGILEAVDHVTAIVTNAQDLFYAGKKAKFSAIGIQMGDELKARQDKKTLRGSAGQVLTVLDNLLRTGNMTPVYFFEHLGNNVLSTLWDDIRQGQNAYAFAMRDGRETIQGLQQRYHYWDWADSKRKDNVLEITTEKGRKLTFTREQALWVYATWKREQSNEIAATKHLTQGGIVYEGKAQEGGKIVTTVQATPAVLSEGDIASITGWLTDEQKAYADGMVKYLSEDMAELGNRASMEMFGIRKYTESYYFPYRVDGDQLYQSSASGRVDTTSDSRLKHTSFTHVLTKGASAALVMGDFSTAVEDHITRMATYASFVLPIESMNRVLNYKVELDDGSLATVRSLIEQKYGASAKNYIATLLTDLNGGVRNDNRASGMNYFIRMYKKGAVAASLSVALQQPTSIFRAMAMISPKYIAASTFSKRDWEELTRYSGVAVVKDMGRFDTDVGRSNIDWLHQRDAGDFSFWLKAKQAVGGDGWKAFSERWDIISGFLPEKMDQITWAHLWNAVKKEQADLHPEMDKKSEAFLALCGERFNDIVDHTQVYDSILSRSQLMRGKDAMSKAVTSFKAEPTVTLNMLYNAAANINKPGGKAKLTRTIAAVMTSNIAAAAMAALVQAWNDDDDERTAATKYMDKFLDNAVDNNNLLTMMPVVSDVYSIIQGYEVERADMSLIGDVWNAFKQLDSESVTTWKKVENLGGSIAKFAGLSVGNYLRDLRRAKNLITSSFTAPSTYELSTALPWAEEKMELHYDALYSAMDSGDKSLETDIREYLETVKGKSDKDIKSGVKSALKDRVLDGSVGKDDAISWLIKNGLADTQKDAFGTVDEWLEKEAFEGDDDDFHYDRFSDVLEAIQSGNSKALADAKAELKKYGYTDKNIYSEICSGIGELFNEGKITESKAKTLLRTYGNVVDENGKIDENEIYWMLEEWKDRKAFSGDDEDFSWSKYNDFYEAVSTGRGLKSAIQELVNHGVEKDIISGCITNHFRKQLVDLVKTGKMTQAAALQAKILDAYVALGYDREKKLKDVKKWYEK